MSLKNTKQVIRDTAEGIALLNAYYDERWNDTIDKLPAYIVSKATKASRVKYTIDFKILDKVADRDEEFNDVQSDTLVIFKDFFSQLFALNLVKYDEIDFEPIEENQLIGWLAKDVEVYEIATC